MDLNKFVAKFAEQFDETAIDAFTPETKFRELDEWSSLIGLSIIAMVDEEYNITLNGADVKKAQTIQDLFDMVKNKL